MFTIGQRLGCRMRWEVGPTRGPTGRADCNDSGALADHHPGVHIEPSFLGRAPRAEAVPSSFGPGPGALLLPTTVSKMGPIGPPSCGTAGPIGWSVGRHGPARGAGWDRDRSGHHRGSGT